MLAVTNAFGRRWWHKGATGLYYIQETDTSFIGPNKSLSEVVALFLQKLQRFPEIEMKPPPTQVVEHWKGSGPILLFELTEIPSMQSAPYAPPLAKQQPPLAAKKQKSRR